MNLFQTCRRNLLLVGTAYCAGHPAVKELSTLGKNVLRDAQFFDRVKGGKARLSVQAYDRAMLEMSRKWPAESVWPEGIDRPSAGGKTRRKAAA